MKLFNNSILFSTVFIVFVGLSNWSYGQCTSFTKKQGFPALAPFIHNGQLTSTKFMPGDEAEIEMTFNAENDYRVLVLWQEVLGDVIFKILDKNKKELYVSKPGEKLPFWDFRVNSTQQLTVVINVPKQADTSTKITPQGCVSILVGFKPKENISKVKMMH